MATAVQEAENTSNPSLWRRAVPLKWQIWGGLLLAIIALAAAQTLAWPHAVSWPTAPLMLLAVTIAAAGAGIAAGMTCVAATILYYGVAFATLGSTASVRNMSWLPLLAVAAICMAAIAGWPREALGRAEDELAGTKRLLKGANNRLATAMEAERLRSQYDRITDLPTRRLVTDRFTQMLAQARRSNTLVALLLVDLKKFQEVNDLIGHDAGDEVLREIGQRLSAVTRQADTVGRLESDTFVVLLSGLTDPAAVSIASQKIAAAITAPLHAGSPPRQVNVSADIGAVLFPRDGEDWEDLCELAEERVRMAGRMA